MFVFSSHYKNTINLLKYPSKIEGESEKRGKTLETVFRFSSASIVFSSSVCTPSLADYLRPRRRRRSQGPSPFLPQPSCRCPVTGQFLCCRSFPLLSVLES